MSNPSYVKHQAYQESNTDRFRQSGELVECDADGNALTDGDEAED